MIKDLLKIIATYLIKVALLPFYLFPINSKKVFFMSYSGLQYSCNPKFICDYFSSNYKDYELVWAFVEPSQHQIGNRIRKVKYLSFAYLYHVITSQYCISNTGFNRFFIIRKSQRFVQTWHGGGAYKRRSLNEVRSSIQILLDKMHDDMITDFVSSSQYFTDFFIKDSVYMNNILNTGMPRNEFLLENKNNERFINEIKQSIGLSIDDSFYILYAPTWRDDGSVYPFPDFDFILQTVRYKFGKEPILLLRSHHFQNLVNNFTCKFVDVRAYPDMQKLLLISDMLISDYSSCIWDYSLLEKPCFLYAPDLKYYEDMRGFYTPIKSWGFDVCQTTDELGLAIQGFSLEQYKVKIKQMHNEFKSFENPNSTSMLLTSLGIN